MGGTPDTSIIIPAHNEESYIEDLLSSLCDCKYQNIEIVVVDNGSTDGTLSIAEKYKCLVVQLSEKAYPSKARNAGVIASRGKWLVFLDADVIVSAHWVSRLAQLRGGLLNLPEHYVTGAAYHMSRSPSWLEEYWFEPLRKKLKSYINGGNIVTTRKTFDLIGGFNSEIETGEDVDFCRRAVESGIEIIIDDGWVVYHEGFPKKAKNFVLRERWHGKGDFTGLDQLLSSKMAIATSVYIALHALFAIAILVGYMPLALISSGSVFGLCLARAAKDIKIESMKHFFVCTFVSYLYFLGRAQSPLLVLFDRFENRS